MRQKKQKLYLYFMLLSAFMISNCGTNNVTNVNPISSAIISTEQSTPVEIDRLTLSPQPDWLVRWLNEPVCQPPCWENITPGKTSFVDTLAIANAILGAKVSYIDEDSISLKSNQYDAYNFALLLSRGDANIQEIHLTTRYTSLELGSIVDRYGFPNKMLKYNSSGLNWIDLLYYDLGMVITFYPLPDDSLSKVSLVSDISIGMIAFYAPQLEHYFNLPSQYGVNITPAIKLNGYGVYNIPDQ